MPPKATSPRAKLPKRALSTGQAAAYCFVTPDTIGNWIKSGHLPAQRTVGGQYRILVEDLRDFMSARGMCTGRLDEEQGTRLPCWEWKGECPVAGASGTSCEDCIVRFLGALHCFKLMAMRPEAERTGCTDCTYYQRWGETPTDLRWTVQSVTGARHRYTGSP